MEFLQLAGFILFFLFLVGVGLSCMLAGAIYWVCFRALKEEYQEQKILKKRTALEAQSEEGAND